MTQINSCAFWSIPITDYEKPIRSIYELPLMIFPVSVPHAGRFVCLGTSYMDIVNGVLQHHISVQGKGNNPYIDGLDLISVTAKSLLHL
jgi:hypothetical protein